MKRFRTIVFWSHLVVGVIAGLVLLTMSVTGVLLTYERQIMEWSDTRGLDGSSPAPGESPLPITDILEHVAAERGQSATSLTWYDAPGLPVTASFGRSGSVYVNAYTGEVIGSGSSAAHRFFDSVTHLHRWLGLKDAGRAVGRAVTGAANLGFLLLVVSGFYLWWPRRWTKPALRQVTFFRRRLSPKARDFNWHNVIGLWCAVPLLIIVLSGVVISYPWASSLVYTLVGEEAPARRGQGGSEQAAGQSPGTTTEPADLSRADALLYQAQARVSDWRTITLQVPSGANDPFKFSIDQGSGGQPQKRSQVSYDAATGDEIQFVTFSEGTSGAKARSILRFAHTGEVLGMFGQTVAGLASLGAALLVWTGLSLSLRRLSAFRKRKRRVAA